jgi:LuxR family quorum sensing-dependent transcriptional regulator
MEAKPDRYWGQRALEAIDAIEAARTPEEALGIFRRSIAQAGFGAHAIIGLPDAQTEFRSRVIANGWPSEWTDAYVKENLCEIDPVALHCSRTAEPFEWSEAPYDPERQPEAHSVMQRAVEVRMGRGFCVPIHYGDGSGAAVTIAGERPELGHGVLAAIHLVALYAHHRVRSLIRLVPLTKNKILTTREREVMQWVAAGKTSWEIGVILDISEATANKHTLSASRKLGAVNRTQAVVNALRNAEITL